MTGISRRRFSMTTGAASALLAAPTILRAEAKPRVVVVGGGAGGATAARYIAKDSAGAIDVTLIEANPIYTTCFFSNLCVGGFRDLGSITFTYDRLAGDMPKSAFAANSQAKVAAMSVRGELVDAKTYKARYANTCWSLIETDDAVKVGAQYEPTLEKIASTSSFISDTGEDAALRLQTAKEAKGWYDGITKDIFG